MAGRHRTPGAPSPTSAQRRVALWGPVVLLAGTAVATMGSLHDPPHAAAGPGARATTGSMAGATAGVAVKAPLPPEPARVPPLLATALVLTGATPGAVAAAAVKRCRTDILAGEAAARAGAASYRDWSKHVQAQLDLDTGGATWLGAVQVWTVTRSAGPGDQQTFARAVRRRAATAGACGAVAAQTSGELRRAATSCQGRGAALDRAIEAGARVVADWARHLATTTPEAAHAPGGPQALPWLATVKATLPTLGRFRQARAALAAAPSCRLG
jgi:hypothetical protein